MGAGIEGRHITSLYAEVTEWQRAQKHKKSTSKMGKSCCAIDCTNGFNRNSEISFYRQPQVTTRRTAVFGTSAWASFYSLRG